jgi:hypothetical protein
LSWDDCLATAGQGLTKVSTCLSNTEAQKTLYGSYVLPEAAHALAGNEAFIDIFDGSGTLPCWWNFTTPSRLNGYGMEFTSPCAGGPNGVFDYWSTVAGGPVGGTQTATFSGGYTRIKGIVAVDATFAGPVPDGTEIYSFTLRLKHGATVGACTGCATPMCIVLSGIKVTQVGWPGYDIYTTSSRSYVKWLGDGLVPASNRTWGSIKALYR